MQKGTLDVQITHSFIQGLHKKIIWMTMYDILDTKLYVGYKRFDLGTGCCAPNTALL